MSYCKAWVGGWDVYLTEPVLFLLVLLRQNFVVGVRNGGLHAVRVEGGVAAVALLWVDLTPFFDAS